MNLEKLKQVAKSYRNASVMDAQGANASALAFSLAVATALEEIINAWEEE